MGQGLYFKGLLSEKMEKYINHDLDLIQEEQEQNAIQMNKNKFQINVDLKYRKNRNTIQNQSL